MAIAAKDVMALRNQTGLGMMECKQALIETDGDVQKAVDLLRKKGLAKMDSRAGRAAAEGRIATALLADKSRGAIVELNTETDFTAKNDAFLQMADRVAQHALNQEPGDVSKTDDIQKEVDEVRLTTKENAQFARGQIIGSGANSRVGSYVHFTGKLGALVEVEGEISDELLTDLCMHIVAISPSPLGIVDEDIPADVVAKEREIAKAQAMESGKPENIAEKMVEGKIRKFLEERVLLKQPFVKDDKKQVQELLPKGATVKAFVRYEVGGAAQEAGEPTEG